MDKLTPQLTETQLKQNIDALRNSKMDTASIQKYVDNYHKDVSGNYVLKTARPVETNEPSYSERVGQEYAQAGQNISQEWKKQMEMTPETTGPLQFAGQSARTALRTAGEVAGAAFSPITEAPIVRQTMDFIGKGISKTSIGQKIGELAQKYPNAAKDIEDIINLAGIGVGQAVERPALQSTKSALEGAGEKFVGGATNLQQKLATRSEKALDKNIIEAITPDLSKTKAAELIAKGGAKVERGTIFDAVSQKVTPRMKEIKDAIKPFYNKSATITENVNNIRSALSNEAENLKSLIAENDHPYTFNELQSKLKKVELPISFKNDATQAKTLRDITDAFMRISRENGGKISSLLDARKQFDALVEENFPNLYDKGRPTNTYYAVTRTRNAINDFIESQLPDINYKNSLKKQSLYYDAIDSLSAKAGEELGTRSNVLTRKAKDIVKKYPGVATGVGLTAGYETAKKLGLPLP